MQALPRLQQYTLTSRSLSSSSQLSPSVFQIFFPSGACWNNSECSVFTCGGAAEASRSLEGSELEEDEDRLCLSLHWEGLRAQLR